MFNTDKYKMLTYSDMTNPIKTIDSLHIWEVNIATNTKARAGRASVPGSTVNPMQHWAVILSRHWSSSINLAWRNKGMKRLSVAKWKEHH